MSKAHENPKVKRRQPILRHLSRERDNWTCTKCGAVACPRGAECFRYSRWQRRTRLYYGSADEKTPEEFYNWKKNFCNGGQKCILRMHHKKQLSEGGKDMLYNVDTLCKKCNSEIQHSS